MSEKPILIEVRTEKYIGDILKLSHLVNPELDATDFYQWLKEAVHSQNVFVIVSLAGERVVGYAITTAPSLLEQYAFVLHAYLAPEYAASGVQMDALRHIEAWAKLRGAKGIRMAAKRRIGAWERKYGFSVHSVIMEKKIGTRGGNSKRIIS